MRLNITGSRLGMVAAATAGVVVVTGAGVAAVPDSSAAGGRVVKFCYSKKAADKRDGGAVLSYFTPGVNTKQCAKGQRLLTLSIPGAQAAPAPAPAASTSTSTSPSSDQPSLLAGQQGPPGPQGPAGPQGPPGPALGGYMYRYTTGTVASLINGRLRLPAAGPLLDWVVDETDSEFTALKAGVYRISYQLDLGLALGFSSGSVQINRRAGTKVAEVNGSDTDAEAETSFAGRDILIKLNEGDIISIQTKGLKIFGGTLMIMRIAELDAS